MKVAHHVIPSVPLETGRLLAAVGPLGATDEVALFFNADTSPRLIASQPGFDVGTIRKIGDRLRVTGRCPDGASTVALPMTTGAARAPLLPPDDLLADTRVAVALRGTETAQTIAQWLDFHRKSQGIEAAMIVDRARPKDAANLVNALSGMHIDGIAHLIIVSFDTPLGQADAGDAALPFYAPDAPGKDRMAAPPPDPWRAPLGDAVLFELLRYLYLSSARGVMNIDLSDLAPSSPNGTLFDQAQAAPDGCIALIGTRIYPWGLRKNTPPEFGDHICERFDAGPASPRWCIAPARLPEHTVWRQRRIDGANVAHPAQPYLRCMALRHAASNLAEIVPKSSLVEAPRLLALAKSAFDATPRRPPRETLHIHPERVPGRVGIVTCMKNEGPFILEWIAYHRAIGVDDFLIYSNDCTDGTDTLLDLLQACGIVQHRDNPYRTSGMKPQHAALMAADHEPALRTWDWVVCSDVDEFINVHVGDGHLSDLFGAVGDANLISMTWRLFGNADVAAYHDSFVTEQFHLCAQHLSRKPHQAWGFKTAFRTLGIFKKLGVHRPKGLRPQLLDQIHWVNGSGQPMPREAFRTAWRSTNTTYGYDLVTLNHYALRSAESFLVKRDRGRVNHVDRDQGLNYWFRMNHNVEEDRSITRRAAATRAEFNRLMADPDIAAAHAACVTAHRAKITALRTSEKYSVFYDEITSPRMQTLSRMLPRFGANVFLQGPGVIPNTALNHINDPEFFFTVGAADPS
ncbi:glycosyltransferase family 2 protein [Roseobacter sp.]|uniref:glycosyltransferase family 2 protein n=1 Tax=Roseobacter sp. TaxID=1907202 RepID=UPI003297B232